MHAQRLSRLGFVNCYLVDEDDGLTLIDALIARSGNRILAAAQGLGRPIARILLTHAHGDHIGSLDELHAAVPEAEVIISARDARLLARDMSLDPGEPEDKLRGSYPGASARPDRELAPGDRVGSLDAIAAPGHTPGQLAFLDSRDRTLYCGDAFSTLGGVATTARPNPLFPLPGWATWHRPTALASARALRALDPGALAPGHGKVVQNPGPEMDRAIEQAS